MPRGRSGDVEVLHTQDFCINASVHMGSLSLLLSSGLGRPLAYPTWAGHRAVFWAGSCILNKVVAFWSLSASRLGSLKQELGIPGDHLVLGALSTFCVLVWTRSMWFGMMVI